MNTDHRDASLLGATNIPDGVSHQDGVGDISTLSLQTRQCVTNNGRLIRRRIGSGCRDHVKDTGEVEMLDLGDRGWSLLRCCGRQRNARVVEVVKQVDHPGEGLGVEIASKVPATVARNQIR